MPKVESALSRESSIRRTAKHVLMGGLGILAMKFGIFWLTDSTAVLADAMESIVNLIAAIIMLYGIWMMQRPGDENRPTAHSKTQYMMIGFEGWLILIIAAVMGYIGVNRLLSVNDTEAPLELHNLKLGIWLSGGVALITTILAFYVLNAGKKHDSQVLIADGKHLLADVASTLGVVVGLSIAHSHYPEKKWIDPVVALILTAIVLYTSWRLMWKSVTGLTDTYEQEIDPTIAMSLDELVKSKTIAGYQDVRYRFNGPHRWVALTVLVDPKMAIRDGQDICKRTEKHLSEEIEDAKIDVNVEPYEGDWPPEIWAAMEEQAAIEEAAQAAAAAESGETLTGDPDSESNAGDETDEATAETAAMDEADVDDVADDDEAGAASDRVSDSERDKDTPSGDSVDSGSDLGSDTKAPAANSTSGEAATPRSEPAKSNPHASGDEPKAPEEPERRFGDDIDNGDQMI